jgi:hypothetical protein
VQTKKASVGHDSTVCAHLACVHNLAVVACVRRPIVACHLLYMHNPMASHLLACARSDVCPFGATLDVVEACWDVCVCVCGTAVGSHSGSTM